MSSSKNHPLVGPVAVRRLRRLALALSCIAVLALGVTFAGAVGEQQAGAVGKGSGKTVAPVIPGAGSTAIVVKRFSHAAHAKEKVDVAVCTKCHAIDTKGLVAPPAAVGHSPCLSSGCHAADFLASGPKTKATDPAKYQRAVGFCLGCHASPTSVAPVPWQGAKAEAAFSGPGEYHVEMNHLDHTARTPCRECHVVDAKSFALVATAPSHAQCISCHDGKPVPAMTSCGTCHKTPPRQEYFTKVRVGSDVRSCDPGQADNLKNNRACFAHEHKGHRFRDDGAELQCGSCHFMVADRAAWNGHVYTSLRDLKAAPIIENQKDRAHKACGGCHHHAADVKDGSGRARCGLCHSERVLNSIFQ